MSGAPYLTPALAAVRSRGLTLALLTTIAAFNTIDRQIISILSTPIRAEFHLSDGQVGTLGLVYGLVFALAAAPMASLADRTSRKAVIIACMGLFSACTTLAGLVTNYAGLLLTRFGVGTGEAGTVAPSLSMIADLYPRAERTMAMSIFSAASKPGGFIAFLAGGWLAQLYGWRFTFLVMGIPGLLLAIFAFFVMREPKIGTSDDAPIDMVKKAPTFLGSLRYIARVPSFWHILIGKSLWSMLTLGLTFWMPHYLERAYGLKLGLIGTTMAVYTLGIGAIGVIGIGYITQRLQRRDIRWLLGTLACSSLIATPFMWIVLTSNSAWIAAIAVVPPIFIYSAHLGPFSSAAQAVVPARMRTVTAGLTQVAAGFAGMGLGPFLPGLLSSALAGRYGDLSIRYSLLAFSILWVWAGIHCLFANRTIAADVERADEENRLDALSAAGAAETDSRESSGRPAIV